MKYGLVRQFYNNSLDNVFKFFFKIVDFWKILVEVFWAIYEIFEAFYLIFYNIFMYIYYLILFAIDKSTESQSGIFFWRKIPRRAAYKPSGVFQREISNPIPASYGRQMSSSASSGISVPLSAARKSAAAKAAAKPSVKLRPPRKPAGGARINIGKKILEFLYELFTGIKNIILYPFKMIASLFAAKEKPVREEATAQSKSLIDEYMKEYEDRKKS